MARLDAANASEAQKMVELFISLACRLNLAIVAEGVERITQKGYSGGAGLPVCLKISALPAHASGNDSTGLFKAGIGHPSFVSLHFGIGIAIAIGIGIAIAIAIGIELFRFRFRSRSRFRFKKC